MINETVEKYLVQEGGEMNAVLKGNDYVITSADKDAGRAHSMFKKGQKIPKEMFLHMIDRYNINATLG
jgi:hypothetical protein